MNDNTRLNIDALQSPIIGVAAEEGRRDEGMQKHHKHHLLFVTSGCVSIYLGGTWCVLPPNRAAWIPAETLHCVVMHNVGAYRSVYFEKAFANNLPDEMKIVTVNGLFRELIERMAHWGRNMPTQEQMSVYSLFCQELDSAHEEPLMLKLPHDRRLKHWLQDVVEGRDLPEPLVVMANDIGASAKTISRIFTRETGMPYQTWRQQWRLQSAIELLSDGESVLDVAKKLHFSSDSAFISFFRKATGSTPGRYFKSSSD